MSTQFFNSQGVHVCTRFCSGRGSTTVDVVVSEEEWVDTEFVHDEVGNWEHKRCVVEGASVTVRGTVEWNQAATAFARWAETHAEWPQVEAVRAVEEECRQRASSVKVFAVVR